MSEYQSLASRITRGVIPVPVFFRQDLSVDHAGIGRYVDWSVSQGTKTLCLTFTYSILDFLTTEELLAVTKTIADAVNGRAIFISCTAGGPQRQAIEIVEGMGKRGADAVMVHPTEFMLQNPKSGELYVSYVLGVAATTKLPVLVCGLPDPWQTAVPHLTNERYAELAKAENFIGLKDDYYQIPFRQGLIQEFGERLCVIGGGMLRNYILFHHYPNQSEFPGLWVFNPKRAELFFELLDAGKVSEAIGMIDEAEQAYYGAPGVHWIAQLLAKFHAAGFAETRLVRPPLVSATEEQADDIVANNDAFMGK